MSPEEYTTRYSTLQDWINARREMVAARDFPQTSGEVSKLLEEFKTLRASEDHEKEKEKDDVRSMAAELNVFAMKRRTELDIPPIEVIEQVTTVLLFLYLFVHLFLSVQQSIPYLSIYQFI